MPEFEQAIIGGTEWHGDSRGQLDVESLRHRPSVPSRNRAQGCMRSHSINSGDLLTYLQVRHLRTYLDDFAAGLVAKHVRLTEHYAMPTIERVTAFDTDSLDANHDAFRMAFGVGNVLVFENLGPAVLIID